MAADLVPHPVLFNAWKHHACWVRGRIAATAGRGEPAVAAVAAELVVVGTRTMDLYVGPLPPAAVADHLLAALSAAGRLAPGAFSEWLADAGGYAVLRLPDDGSRWAVRAGPADGRYVHIHPGRGSPGTVRVTAPVWKTAILARTWAAAVGEPLGVGAVNGVRRRFLGLPPVPAVGAGLAAALTCLDEPAYPDPSLR